MGCQFITQRVGGKERRVVASQLDMARFFTPYDDKGLLKNSGLLRDDTKFPPKCSANIPQNMKNLILALVHNCTLKP